MPAKVRLLGLTTNPFALLVRLENQPLKFRRSNRAGVGDVGREGQLGQGGGGSKPGRGGNLEMNAQ